MKRIVTAAILILSSLPSWVRAQEENSRPFAEDHKRWIYEHQDFLGKYPREYSTEGDTIIGGHTCFRLYYRDYQTPAWKYVGAIFDEGRKSYLIDEGDEEARLLLDFDVRKGDVLRIGDEELRVDEETIEDFGHGTFRTLLIYNITRSQMGSSFEESWGYWIEGVGSLSPYLTAPSYWSVYDHRTLAACFVDEVPIFGNDDYISAVRNASSDFLQTETGTTPICDLQGRKVSEKGEVISEKLPRGVYIQNGRKFVVR